MLGDPLQLPPTVREKDSLLELSLMERLCRTLPEPVIVTAKKDNSEMDEEWLKRVRGNAGEVRMIQELVGGEVTRRTILILTLITGGKLQEGVHRQPAAEAAIQDARKHCCLVVAKVLQRAARDSQVYQRGEEGGGRVVRGGQECGTVR
jgi:hypothetical protein